MQRHAQIGHIVRRVLIPHQDEVISIKRHLKLVNAGTLTTSTLTIGGTTDLSTTSGDVVVGRLQSAEDVSIASAADVILGNLKSGESITIEAVGSVTDTGLDAVNITSVLGAALSAPDGSGASNAPSI